MIRVFGVIFLMSSNIALAQATQNQPNTIIIRPAFKDLVMQKPMGVDPSESPKFLEQVQKNTAIGSAQVNLGNAQTLAIKDLAEKLEKLDARVKELEAARSKK